MRREMTAVGACHTSGEALASCGDQRTVAKTPDLGWVQSIGVAVCPMLVLKLGMDAWRALYPQRSVQVRVTSAGADIARGPALGVLEIGSIARGVVVADAALKRAPAVLLSSRAVSGGKHLVMLEGGVAEVEEAMHAGALAAGDRLLDRVQ